MHHLRAAWWVLGGGIILELFHPNRCLGFPRGFMVELVGGKSMEGWF